MILAHFSSRFADAFFPRLLEWQAAGVTFGGGLMMLLNENLMVASKPGYALMLEWATQTTWAYTVCFVGFIRLLVLVINGAWRKSPHSRAAMAFATCALWFVLASSFSATAGWGFVLATGMLIGDFLNIARTMRDARIVDDEYRRRRINAR